MTVHKHQYLITWRVRVRVCRVGRRQITPSSFDPAAAAVLRLAAAALLAALVLWRLR